MIFNHDTLSLYFPSIYFCLTRVCHLNYFILTDGCEIYPSFAGGAMLKAKSCTGSRSNIFEIKEGHTSYACMALNGISWLLPLKISLVNDVLKRLRAPLMLEQYRLLRGYLNVRSQRFEKIGQKPFLRRLQHFE
jgi:hypothetical protein